MTCVALADRHLHADDDGFLADIEVAEAADQAHAVQLAGALLEAADEQHLREGVQLLFLGRVEAGRLGRGRHRASAGRRRLLAVTGADLSALRSALAMRGLPFGCSCF